MPFFPVRNVFLFAMFSCSIRPCGCQLLYSENANSAVDRAEIWYLQGEWGVNPIGVALPKARNHVLRRMLRFFCESP